MLLDSELRLEFFSYYDAFNKLTDYSDDALKKLITRIESQEKKYRGKEKKSSNSKEDSMKYWKKLRTAQELEFYKKFVQDIQDKRTQKYILPVMGAKIPTKENKIPNAGRPYRQKYTDGIHHSWDIDVPLGTPVVALDDGIVVRIVSNWDWSDFQKLRYSANMSYEDELRNFDIYRGNQVRIKTTK